jgi:hypothetical protein
MIKVYDAIFYWSRLDSFLNHMIVFSQDFLDITNLLFNIWWYPYFHGLWKKVCELLSVQWRKIWIIHDLSVLGVRVCNYYSTSLQTYFMWSKFLLPCFTNQGSLVSLIMWLFSLSCLLITNLDTFLYMMISIFSWSQQSRYLKTIHIFFYQSFLHITNLDI